MGSPFDTLLVLSNYSIVIIHNTSSNLFTIHNFLPRANSCKCVFSSLLISTINHFIGKSPSVYRIWFLLFHISHLDIDNTNVSPVKFIGHFWLPGDHLWTSLEIWSLFTMFYTNFPAWLVCGGTKMQNFHLIILNSCLVAKGVFGIVTNSTSRYRAVA